MLRFSPFYLTVKKNSHYYFKIIQSNSHKIHCDIDWSAVRKILSNDFEYPYEVSFSQIMTSGQDLQLLLNHQDKTKNHETIFDMHWLVYQLVIYTVEPLLRGHPDERPLPLERPLVNVNLNINVLIFLPLTRGHPSWKATFLMQKGWPHKRGSTVDKNNKTSYLKWKAWTFYIHIAVAHSLVINGVFHEWRFYFTEIQ